MGALRDIGQQLRAAYFAALNGKVTYNLGVIPVVDEKLDQQITQHDLYIRFMDQIGDHQNNMVKSHWSAETLLRIEICAQRQTTVNREILESIADQVDQLICPSNNTNGLSLSGGISLTYARLVNSQYTDVQTDTPGFMVTKILTYKNRLTVN